MRKIFLVLIVLLVSNLHAQKKSSDKTTFDYSKFVGMWYNRGETSLCVWKEKNEYKVAMFSNCSGDPIEILSVSKKNKRFYFETFFSYTSWHTKQELTYLENDTLQCVITGDGNNTVIYTRYDFKTYNPPFLVISDEN